MAIDLQPKLHIFTPPALLRATETWAYFPVCPACSHVNVQLHMKEYLAYVQYVGQTLRRKVA